MFFPKMSNSFFTFGLKKKIVEKIDFLITAYLLIFFFFFIFITELLSFIILDKKKRRD